MLVSLPTRTVRNMLRHYQKIYKYSDDNYAIMPCFNMLLDKASWITGSNYVVDGVWLNKWLNEQKHMAEGRRKKTLTDEQRKKLESIGMVF